MHRGWEGCPLTAQQFRHKIHNDRGGVVARLEYVAVVFDELPRGLIAHFVLDVHLGRRERSGVGGSSQQRVIHQQGWGVADGGDGCAARSEHAITRRLPSSRNFLATIAH